MGQFPMGLPVGYLPWTRVFARRPPRAARGSLRAAYRQRRRQPILIVRNPWRAQPAWPLRPACFQRLGASAELDGLGGAHGDCAAALQLFLSANDRLGHAAVAEPLRHGAGQLQRLGRLLGILLRLDGRLTYQAIDVALLDVAHDL